MSGIENGNGDRPHQSAPEGVRENATTQVNTFTRRCSRILKQYQSGQLSLAESMVQIAVQVSEARIGVQEAKTIARHYYKQLEQVHGSLTRNTHTETGNNQTVSDAVDAVEAHAAATNTLRRQCDKLQHRPPKRRRHDQRYSYDSEHSSSNNDIELDESDDELVPWSRPNFDRDYNAEDKRFIELYNKQLTWWNHHRKSWHGVLQSLLNKFGKPLFPESEWEKIVCG